MNKLLTVLFSIVFISCEKPMFEIYNVEISSSNPSIITQTRDIIKKRLDNLEIKNTINMDTLSSKLTVTIYGCNDLEKTYKDCGNIYEKKFIASLIKSKGKLEFFHGAYKSWTKSFSELEYNINTKYDSLNLNDENKKAPINLKEFNKPIFGGKLYLLPEYNNSYVGVAKSTDTAKINSLLKKNFPFWEGKFLWMHKFEEYNFGGDIIYGKLLVAVKIPISGESELDGEDIKLAEQSFDEMGNPSVRLTFNSNSSTIWADMTEEGIGKTIAIVLDDQVLSAPTVMEMISGGNVEISGGFETIEEAQKLASILNFEELPTSVNIVQ
jgi:hypothetical protein